MPHYPHILEGIAERSASLSDQERGHLMDLARLLRANPTERFAKVNEHSKAHMEALAKLVGIPSRQFKTDAMQREWIDREEAMRLVPALRDHGSALATLLREEVLRGTDGVASRRQCGGLACPDCDCAPVDGVAVVCGYCGEADHSEATCGRISAAEQVARGVREVPRG